MVEVERGEDGGGLFRMQVGPTGHKSGNTTALPSKAHFQPLVSFVSTYKTKPFGVCRRWTGPYAQVQPQSVFGCGAWKLACALQASATNIALTPLELWNKGR